MNVRVRQATPVDAKQVADLLNGVIAEGCFTLFDTPFSEEDERRFISSLPERSAMFVAENDDEITGVQVIDLFLGYASSTRHVATMGTWLRPDMRGRGIGRLLAAESLRFARAHDYLKVVIHVLADNERALRFYRSLGFEDIGRARMHVRLGSQFHDEIYMEMLLIEP